MKRPSDHEGQASWEHLRERIIGLGERSTRKSYYPELRARLDDLERFRALLDQSSDAIMLVALPEARVADANQAASRMLGGSVAELIGRPVETLAPAIAERIRQPRENARAQGRLSASLPTGPAGSVPVEVAVSFVALGDQRYAVAVLRDVTERRRAESALRESERRWRAVFEGTAIGMAVASPDGRLLESNAILQQQLGLSAEQLRGADLLSLIHPDDAEQTRRQLAALVESRSDEYLRVEKRCLGGQGRVLWVLLSASLVRDAAGAPDYLVLAVQDISARKRAEEALHFLSRASVQLSSSLSLEEILHTLSELAVPRLGELCAVYLRAADGSFERQGLRCGSPAKKELADRLQGDWPEPIREALGVNKVLTGGAAQLSAQVSDALLAASAREPAQLALWRALEVRSALAVPLTGRSGLIGALLLARLEQRGREYDELDLSLAQEFAGRAALALENARLYREAQEVSRVKDEFLAIVSHELRTPLTAILGWAWMLGSSARGRPGVASEAEAIQRSAKALARIIDDLLDVSRMVAGKLKIERVPIDLAPVVEAAVAALRPEAAQRGVLLTTRCAQRLPYVLGDAQRLQQVVWNLISNGVKYTPAAGRIDVTLDRSGSSARIEVRDNGIGMSREFLPHAFERFRQADSTSKRARGGLGLGLTIVQQLVSLHGGQVRAASAGMGKGTCFTVILPFHRGAEHEAGGGAGELGRAEAPRLDGRRLLVVEDDADGREVLAELLESQGARVAAAASVREALSAIEREPQDLVVSDLAMPQEDGFALLSELRRRGVRVPCVALSAHTRPEDCQRSLAAGFERHLPKPIDPDALFCALGEVLEHPLTAAPEST